jgi:hypothetical protein
MVFLLAHDLESLYSNTCYTKEQGFDLLMRFLLSRSFGIT